MRWRSWAKDFISDVVILAFSSEAHARLRHEVRIILGGLGGGNIMFTDADRERLHEAFNIWRKWGHLFTEGKKCPGIDAMLSKPMSQLWPDIYNEGYRAGVKNRWSKGSWGLKTAVICLWLVNFSNAAIWLLSAALK